MPWEKYNEGTHHHGLRLDVVLMDCSVGGVAGAALREVIRNVPTEKSL